MNVCDFCLIRETEGIYCGTCLFLMDQLVEIADLAGGSSFSVLPENHQPTSQEGEA